jgi:hypothetical protein
MNIKRDITQRVENRKFDALFKVNSDVDVVTIFEFVVVSETIFIIN